MPFESKDKETLIDDVADAILEKLPDLDFSDGEPIRTIIEAIMNELDLQYWQLQQIYDNSFIDTAYGDDLTNLVKLMGVERNPALQSTGQVKFYRATPATLDYAIPAGTLVETLPDANGNIISFQTTENVILATGQTYVLANVTSVEPGANSNVTAGKVIIINDPPFGIESVVNDEAIIGGEDEESDDDLKARTSSALEASGKGTINAITYKLQSTPGVKSVKVNDMARGIGTMDILILGDSIPMPQSKIDELNAVLQDVKSGGIDFQIVEPSQTITNVSVTLNLNDSTDFDSSVVNTAITNYFSNLKIGDSLIINQLSRKILEASDNIIDIASITPNSNVVSSISNLITLGTINITW
jgi:uncharacterized phage protein gp47/JayE